MSESLYYNNEEDGNTPDILTGICSNCGNKLSVSGIPTKLNSEGNIELPVANTNIVICSQCNAKRELKPFDHDIGVEATLEDKEKIFGDLSAYPLLRMGKMVK